MSVVRTGAALAALFAASLAAQDPLASRVVAQLDEALATATPEQSANVLWQACCAEHGEIEPLLQALQERVEAKREPGASRLLCGVLRYQGRPEEALSALAAISASQLQQRDLLLRAELLDTIGRGDDAAQAYEKLLELELEPDLRRRILFRRALVGSDSIEQLKAFAQRAENDVAQRNQAAILLALRNDPLAALDLYEVQGEGTARFRQLVRLADWAMAAKAYDRAQEFAWQAVGFAKMRRDQRYALTVVVSAYRAGDAIDELLERFESTPELKKDARQIWIDLLRDEGRVDDALRLFREKGEGEWTPALRRQLLEICRETGREDVLITQFRDLIAAEPENLEWRSGLSRHHLENGNREDAKKVWADFGNGASAQRKLDAAYKLMDLGLDDRAEHFARAAGEKESLREIAQMFLVKLFVARGRFEEAVTSLEKIEADAQGKDSILAEVAGIYERMDRLDKAVAVLDRMRAAFGGFLGTDLDMKYALLLSKVDREADALQVWRDLWSRVRSTPRGRYVEDRMMTVAARLGVLAKIAIELEDRLDAGTADTTDVELLVRLYIKVGDSAAATEITEQALRGSNVGDVELIRRKATIYLACHDYREYEALIEQLVERDPENRIEHMRELTLSRLERGRRAQAIEKLPMLREASVDGGIADEFEAGIFQLAGLKDRALKSYTKGLGRYPDRIDTHLLVANLMRETGREMEAARRFQYLASTAERDDLFTIAIDGILNLRAQQDTKVSDDVVDWAMRVTLERLSERSHRFYLHRLAADLAEERNDMPMSIRTLTAGLPVAGERRTALLREILGKVRSLDRNARTMFGGSRAMKISPDWDAKPYVMIGRRLLGQGEVVPPQVYMDLAAVFLHVDAVPDAMRTFSRAAELLDRGEVHRQAAAVLEEAERYDAALQFYRRLLSVDADDVALMAKIGRLEELSGRDDAAFKVYEQALASALRQTQTQVHVAAEEEPDPDDLSSIYGGQRNVDALQLAIPKLVQGLLVTLPEDRAESFLQKMARAAQRDLEQLGAPDPGEVQTIDQFPRLAARATALRRLALCYRLLPLCEPIDAALLQRFPTDRELAKATIGYRADRGFHVAAARLLKGSEFVSDPDFVWLVATDAGDGLVSPAVAAARVLPMLVNEPAALRELLDNVDAAAFDASNIDTVPVLLGACALVGATDAAERIARSGVRINANMSERERVLGNRQGATAALRLANRIDPDLRQSLLNYRVERTAAKGAKALVSLQYELEGESGFKLDADMVEQMLRTEVANSAQEQFGLRSMGLLSFLPVERRAPLVRELYTAAPASQRMNVLVDGADHLQDPLDEGFVEWFEATFAREFADADKSKRQRAGFGFGEGSKQLRRIKLEKVVAHGGGRREWGSLLGILVEMGDREAAVKLLEEGIPEKVARDDLAGLVPGRPKGMDKRQIDESVEQFAGHGLVADALRIVEEKLAKTPRHEVLRYLQWQLRLRSPGASEFVAKKIDATSSDSEELGKLLEFQRARGRLVEAGDTLRRLVEVDEKGKKRWEAQLKSIDRQLDNTAKASKRPAGQNGPRRMRRGEAQPSRKVAALAKLDDEAEAKAKFRGIWRGREKVERYPSPFGPRIEINVNPASLETVAGKDFAIAEMRRMLRLLEDAGELGSLTLTPSIIKHMPAAADAVAGVQQRLQSVTAGNGGTVEALHLLHALSSDELSDEVRASVVDALVRRRETPDEVRMRKVADQLCAMGQKQAAAGVYRLGVLASGEGQPAYFYRMRGMQPDLGETVADIRGQLGDELGRTTAVDVFDDVIAVRESPEAMLAALKAWPDLLDDEQRSRRVLALHERVKKMRKSRYGGLTFSDAGVPLVGAFCQVLAQAGKLDAAMLEFSELVRAATPDVYGRVPTRRESVVKEQLEMLLAMEGPHAKQWLRKVGESVVQWQSEGGLQQPVAVLGMVGKRLAEAGEQQLANGCADALAVLAPDDTIAERQLAHVWRANGDEAKAWALEKRLLAQRRLAIEDHARVIKTLREAEGDAKALAAGERALQYTKNNDLLTAMIEIAEAAGDVDRARQWRETFEARNKKPEKKATEAKEPAREAG